MDGAPVIRPACGDDLVVWPDGSHCFFSELAEHMDRSDDFQILVFGTDEYDAFIKAN